MKLKLLLLIISLTTSIHLNAQIPSGAVAQYNFDNSLKDVIIGGNANFTTSASTNTTYAQDRFSNVSASLRVAGNTYNGYTFRGTHTEMSISFWIFIPSSDPSVQRLMQVLDVSGNGFKIFFDGSAQILQVDVTTRNGQGNYVGNLNVGSLNLKGSWHHMALTVKQNGNSYDNFFYLDGDLNTTISNGISANVGGNFLVSNAVLRLSPSSAQDFSGIMDDIVVYEKPLTATEVNDLYTLTDPNLCKVNIPDANFKAALLDHGVGITSFNTSKIDTNNDGEIQCSEATAYNGYINVPSRNITTLTGIEAFTNLTGLFCGYNNLASLNITNNTKLERLVCTKNQLTSLDVSQNTNLDFIRADLNQITSLDVSVNIKLESLDISLNKLTSLNVANGINGYNTIRDDLYYVKATGNTNLSCIQHDVGFDPIPSSNWTKNTSAIWSTNCATASIADKEFTNAISLYPNPASNIITISADNFDVQKIEIYDTIGKKVLQTTNKSINISTFSKGIYFVKISSTNDRIGIKKLIKN